MDNDNRVPTEIRFASMKRNGESTCLTAYFESSRKIEKGYKKEKIDKITLGISYDDRSDDIYDLGEITKKQLGILLASNEINEIISKHQLYTKEMYQEGLYSFPGKKPEEIFDEFGNLLPGVKETYKPKYNISVGGYEHLKNFLGDHNEIFNQNDKYFYKQATVIPRDIKYMKSMDDISYNFTDSEEKDEYGMYTRGEISDVEVMLTEKNIKGAYDFNMKLIDMVKDYGDDTKIEKYNFKERIDRTSSQGFGDSKIIIEESHYLGTVNSYMALNVFINDENLGYNGEINEEQINKILHSNELESLSIIVDDSDEFSPDQKRKYQYCVGKVIIDITYGG